jgi:quercetin dioxygenase-like cupin family protein
MRTPWPPQRTTTTAKALAKGLAPPRILALPLGLALSLATAAMTAAETIPTTTGAMATQKTTPTTPATAGAATATSATAGKQGFTPEKIPWAAVPQVPGVEIAPLVGRTDLAGLYVVRVRLKAGARIPAHSHPDRRVTTVLFGTLYGGIGPTFRAEGLRPWPTGSLYTVEAGVSHFLSARDGEVIYEEVGIGPSGMSLQGLRH